MIQKENKPVQGGFQPADGMKMIAVAGQVGCVTLLSVLLAVFLGLYLDRVLGTRPLILILLVLGSAPLSLLLTYYIAIRATQQTGQPIPKQEDSEDTRGET
jgi:F0F1-type ATP synthase assembly protein I